MLDDEGAGEAVSFPCVRTVLVPGRLLVEHDVAQDNHLASTWVIEPVRLGTFLIGVLQSSSLVRTGFVFLTWPMQPNILRKDTLRLCQYLALNSITPFRAIVGARLRMSTAGMLLAFIMDRAMPTTVWFRRSTMPFCYGEYGVVWCRTTP